VSLFTLSISLGLLFNQSNQELININENTVRNEFITRMNINSEFVTEQIALTLALPLYNYDYGMLKLLADVAVADDDIVSLRIFDTDNNFLIRSSVPDKYKLDLSTLDSDTLNKISNHQTILIDGLQHFVLIAPIEVFEKVIGGVEITFSRIGVQQDILLMRELGNAANDKNTLKFYQVAILVTLIVCLLVITASYLITAWLVHPIQAMADFATRIGRGESLPKIPMNQTDELGELANSMGEMASNLELRSYEINHLAYHDYLTDLPNRLMFTAELENWIDTFLIQKKKFSTLLLDLDNFKQVNDQYGHDIGDELLINVSARLSRILDADHKEHLYKRSKSYFLGRLGSDQFILLIEVIDENDAQGVAQQILNNFKSGYKTREFEIAISVSIGVSVYPLHGDQGASLFQNAEIALFDAKNSGKSVAHLFTQEMSRQFQVKIELEKELRKAIATDALEVWYQPIFDLQSNKLNGAEALVRWIHPERGFISPATFIPLAEETGQMILLGQLIIDKICTQLSAWQNQIEEDFHVAINISAIQLKQKNLIEFILNQVKTKKINLRHIHIEITETALIQHDTVVQKTLDQFSELGMPIWLDDFGTGFSSLSHLKNFPVSGVKIDRSFVSDLDSKNQGQDLVIAVMELAKALRLNLIAEGIETPEQYELLKSNQCTYGQGYLMGRPVPASDFKMKSFNQDTQ